MSLRFLALLLPLSVPPVMGVEGTVRLSYGCSALGVRLGAPLPPVGGGRVPSSYTRVTLARKCPWSATSPLGFITLTGVLTPPPFRFFVFLGFAAFDVAFILIMLTLAAISACYRTAEIVLVLHLLTIFSFLLALQLEQARTTPIKVGRVAGSYLLVRRTAVERIGGPFTVGGGGSPSYVSTDHRGPSQG